MKAMILAAGLGTRLQPFTLHHPKALAIVNNKTLLQRNIEYLQQYGIRDVVVNVHHFGQQIIDIINANNGWGSAITISDETDVVLETGGGLLKAAPLLADADPFVLMNVDILTDLPLSDMMAFHTAKQPLATLATTGRQTSRYFLFNEVDVLCGWRNIKTGEEKISKKATIYQQKAFSGIHIISNRIFNLINRQGKFSIVDVYLELAKANPICGFDHSNSQFIDVGKPESLENASLIFK